MRSLVFSPDSKTLASHAYDNLIHLWDSATGEKRHELKGHRGQVNGFSFSPDGKQLASCSWQDNVVRLWDVVTGREVRQLKGEGKNVYAVAWSPDGKTVAASGENVLYLWDLATGRRRAGRTDTEPIDYGAPSRIAYLPDGSALAGLHTTTIRLYDPVTAKVLRTLPSALVAMRDLVVSPDCKRIAASGALAVERWDLTSG
jgi:WD40 repeat protein